MHYATSIDVVGTADALAETIKAIAELGGNIQNIKLDSNGNYNADITHADRAALVRFVTDHVQGEEPDSWIQEQITEVYDSGEFDLSKWSVESPWNFVAILKSVVEVAGDAIRLVNQDGKMLVIYAQTDQDLDHPNEFVGPGLMAFEDGEKLRTFSRKGFVPNF